jgi:cytochrome c oxidase assembly protein subunit 11
MATTAELSLRNRQMMTKLLVVAGGMLAFAFALVPMYRQICEAIGITQTREVSPVNTQVDRCREVKLHPGELVTVRYRVVNTLGRPVTANAVMNTAPAVAARWIEKQECFCFTEQTLAAGESREMPVVFRVSPQAPGELSTISLSYTFFEIRGRT